MGTIFTARQDASTQTNLEAYAKAKNIKYFMVT